MTNKIILRNIRFYAHHGVLAQERTVGAFFFLNLELTTDFKHAMQADDMDGTISYAEVYDVVKAEMQIPSQTLENVASRVCKALFKNFSALQTINIELFKENPPIGADALTCGVSVFISREEI